MVKKNLFTFTLDVDWRRLINKRSPNDESTETFGNVPSSEGIDETPIVQDMYEPQVEDKSYYLVDHTKNKIRLHLTMMDILSQKSIPLTSEIPCWWCRYTFKTCPIGLPIRYNSDIGQLSDVFKAYLVDKNLSQDTTDFFETEGIFCSFPCCKAYIMDQSFNTKYKKSNTLLSLMYYKLFGIHQSIPRAPSWKLLQQAGGPLTISTYRSNFGKVVYNSIPNLKRPFMFSVGEYFEEIKVK